MLIKELCCQAGVSKETIRHYERLGLISWVPKKAGSRVYRDYDKSVLERLEYIKLGKRLGFTLKEIKPLLDVYYSQGLTVEEQLVLLEQQVDRLELKIQALQETKALMRQKIIRIQTRQCRG